MRPVLALEAVDPAMVMRWADGGRVGGRGGTGGRATSGGDGDISAAKVAERVGVKVSVLGVWDRDHGVGPSRSDEMGRQGYSRDDVLRVGLMSQLSARGVPAGDAARVVLTMNTAQLQAQLDGITQHETKDGSRARSNAANFVPERVGAIVAAATELDVDTVANLYAESLDEYGVVTAWTEILAPCLHLIGQQWEGGLLGVESEHLASDLLISELTSFCQRRRVDAMAPIKVLLASADGDLHHLPLRVVETELARYGMRCIPLGADVPASALAAAITRRRPHHVFLWASLTRPDPDPMWEHLRAAEYSPHIVTGGPGWAQPARTGHCGPPRPQWVDHATDLRQALHLLTVPLHGA